MSNSAEKSIEQTDQAMLETETVSTSEEEAEEFAKAIMQRAASLKVVKIQRDVFLAHRDQEALPRDRCRPRR